MRPIDADELLNDIEDAIDIENDGQDVKKSKLIILGLKIAKKYIKKARTIEAEPVKHGKWENGHCTHCGEDVASKLDTWTDVQNFIYCPNCGSKNRMDGDSDG